MQAPQLPAAFTRRPKTTPQQLAIPAIPVIPGSFSWFDRELEEEEEVKPALEPVAKAEPEQRGSLSRRVRGAQLPEAALRGPEQGAPGPVHDPSAARTAMDVFQSAFARAAVDAPLVTPQPGSGLVAPQAESPTAPKTASPASTWPSAPEAVATQGEPPKTAAPQGEPENVAAQVQPPEPEIVAPQALTPNLSSPVPQPPVPETQPSPWPPPPPVQPVLTNPHASQAVPAPATRHPVSPQPSAPQPSPPPRPVAPPPVAPRPVAPPPAPPQPVAAQATPAPRAAAGPGTDGPLLRRKPGASLAAELREHGKTAGLRPESVASPRDPEAVRSAFEGFEAGWAKADEQSHPE
jgi:hypothetical protein